MSPGATTAIIVSCFVVLITMLLGWQFKSRWISAAPNEWLLLIKDGELRKKGVGTSDHVILINL